VRRKREHLLNQIQAQAKQIETLMRELENVSSERDHKLSDHLESKFNHVRHSSDPVFDDSENLENSIADTESPDLNENPEANEVLAKWVAKAKESFKEFGTFLAIGGAALPKSYLMDADEDSDSTDEEYVDAEEPMDDDDDSIQITVEGHTTESPSGERSIHHKSSASSMDTSVTSSTRRRMHGESSKPANLPVEASPFGLFGNMMLKSPKSRENSVEPEEEAYSGPGIANENFFSASECANSRIDHQFPDCSFHSSRPECSRPQIGNHATPVAGYSHSKYHLPARCRESFQNIFRQHESFGISLGPSFVHGTQNDLSQSILVYRQ